GVCGLVGAVDDKKAVDPIGTWKCEYEIGGQKRTSTLTIKKDGDKLAGTMSWPDQKETKLKDLKLKDDTLTFSAVRKFMDNEITAITDPGTVVGTLRYMSPEPLPTISLSILVLEVLLPGAQDIADTACNEGRACASTSYPLPDQGLQTVLMDVGQEVPIENTS